MHVSWCQEQLLFWIKDRGLANIGDVYWDVVARWPRTSLSHALARFSCKLNFVTYSLPSKGSCKNHIFNLTVTWEHLQRYNIAAFWTIVPGPTVSSHYFFYCSNIDVQCPLSLILFFLSPSLSLHLPLSYSFLSLFLLCSLSLFLTFFPKRNLTSFLPKRRKKIRPQLGSNLCHFGGCQVSKPLSHKDKDWGIFSTVGDDDHRLA